LDTIFLTHFFLFINKYFTLSRFRPQLHSPNIRINQGDDFLKHRLDQIFSPMKPINNNVVEKSSSKLALTHFD